MFETTLYLTIGRLSQQSRGMLIARSALAIALFALVFAVLRRVLGVLE